MINRDKFDLLLSHSEDNRRYLFFQPRWSQGGGCSIARRRKTENGYVAIKNHPHHLVAQVMRVVLFDVGKLPSAYKVDLIQPRWCRNR